MTRTRIVAAAVLLSALTARAAFAHGWPGGTSMLEQFELEIPAGALPPGPATGELASEGNHFRVRFEMPAAGPGRVSLWGDYRSAPPTGRYEAVVRSDRGGTFRAAIEPSRDPRRGPPLFLGSADELATFSRAVGARLKASEPSNTADLITGIELGATSEIAPPDCRRLAFARYVVVALRGNESVQGVLGCAARGANVLIIGRATGKSDAALGALARFGVGSRAVAWGLGNIAWLPSMQYRVGEAVAQLDSLGQANDINYRLGGSFEPFVGDDAHATPKGVPGSSLVLVLLALYVAVIGPIGYFVGVRPRRAWLAWSWFPLVALGATIALAAVSSVWRGKPAELAINRTSLVAPTGVGLVNTDIRLQGSSAARYTVSAPWRDGDLRSLERGYRFGTPFAAPAGSLALMEDRIAGRLDVDGLTVGRFGTAGVSWVEPVARGGIEVARRGDRFAIANHMSLSIRRAVVKGAKLCGMVDAVLAGAEIVVAAVDCETLKPSENAGTRAWHRAALAHEETERPTAGSMIVVAEIEEPSALRARPTVKTRSNDIVLVRGPLAGGEEAP